MVTMLQLSVSEEAATRTLHCLDRGRGGIGGRANTIFKYFHFKLSTLEIGQPMLFYIIYNQVNRYLFCMEQLALPSANCFITYMQYIHMWATNFYPTFPFPCIYVSCLLSIILCKLSTIYNSSQLLAIIILLTF